MEIFVQLGADSSLLYQAVIMIVILVLSKFLFLNHLQSILESRENKTTKLERSADKKFEEVEKLEAQYKEKISTANKEIRTQTEQEKAVLTKEVETRYREEEKNANAQVEAKRIEAQEESEKIKSSILSSADELSNLLVEKITKG